MLDRLRRNLTEGFQVDVGDQVLRRGSSATRSGAPAVGTGSGLRAASAALVGACLLLVGCGGSGEGEGADTSARPPRCKEPGIRYAGKTASGVEVCFTLSPDAKTWREIAYHYLRKRGCPGPGQGIYIPTVGEGSGPGRIIFDDFAARIRGLRASGFIADELFCNGKRFTWSARATRPLTAQALRNLNPAPRSVCRKPGIHYVGRAARGTVVICFTLNSYRSSVIETGWSFGRVSGCGGDVEGGETSSTYKFDLEPAGHFDNEGGLTGTIHGDRASGLLTDPDTCPTRTFKWHARRTQ